MSPQLFNYINSQHNYYFLNPNHNHDCQDQLISVVLYEY
jgi:hypothetical protein